LRGGPGLSRARSTADYEAVALGQPPIERAGIAANPFDWQSEGNTMDSKNIVLNVNGIEVIYNHVILVLKGVSLQVPEGSIVAILGGNGAGKTTTLRAVSNLLKGERGEVTKGNRSICAASASRTSRLPIWSSAAWCR
jgi:ABC-type glutathione transport system ATPase component